MFVNGRGDMGRTPILSRTDLLVSHEFELHGSQKLRFELNVLNLFNQKTATHIFNYLNRGAGLPRQSSAINLSNVDLSKGYDYNALLLAHARRRQRVRSALRSAGPVPGRHAGSGQREVHLLASSNTLDSSKQRGGSRKRPPLFFVSEAEMKVASAQCACPERGKTRWASALSAAARARSPKVVHSLMAVS